MAQDHQVLGDRPPTQTGIIPRLWITIPKPQWHRSHARCHGHHWQKQKWLSHICTVHCTQLQGGLHWQMISTGTASLVKGVFGVITDKWLQITMQPLEQQIFCCWIKRKKRDWCQSLWLAVETGTLQPPFPLPPEQSRGVNACVWSSPPRLQGSVGSGGADTVSTPDMRAWSKLAHSAWPISTGLRIRETGSWERHRDNLGETKRDSEGYGEWRGWRNVEGERRVIRHWQRNKRQSTSPRQ